MTTDKLVRIMAGTLVLAGTAIALWVSPWGLALTAFVGLNLIQSSFTGLCPAGSIFNKLGIGKGGSCSRPS